MKICFKCNIEKEIGSFYVHKQMSDGHLNKCIDCTKKDTKRISDILTSTPEGLESERKRHRDKYKRLNYKDKQKPNYESKKKAMDKYKAKYPDKIKAKNLSSGLKANTKGNNLHHWSYNPVHAKDVIELTLENHSTLHRFLSYDKDLYIYRELNGNLLDTKDKHIEYMNRIFKAFNDIKERGLLL